jgi:hypothetical protein
VIVNGIVDTVIHADQHRNVIWVVWGEWKLSYNDQQRELIANICYFPAAGVTYTKLKNVAEQILLRSSSDKETHIKVLHYFEYYFCLWYTLLFDAPLDFTRNSIIIKNKYTVDFNL